MPGAVTTPHALATEAGAQAFTAGGNAIDAALAAAAVLTVVYPHQCSIGGDLFALVDDGAGRVSSINGSGAAAAATMADRLRERSPEIPDSGPDSITVPGVVGAWQTLHGLGARLPLHRLLAPAIRAAAEGVPVADSLARGIRFRRETLLRDAGIRDVFLPGGVPLAAGSPLRQWRLARSLERLAQAGLEDFYTGALAGQLLAGLKRLGSPLTLGDFAAHRSEVTDSLERNHRGFQLHTSPPNSQGFMLLEAIAALDAAGIDVEPLGANARSLLCALLLAAEDRDRYLGDPRHAALPWNELMDPAALRRRLRARAAGAATSAAATTSIPAHGDTVAVCALDSNGVAVSLIQSLYQTFGSGLLDPNTGVIFHNRARGFSLSPGAPNELMSGMRPAHTLLPLLVRREARTVAVLGTMGGRAQAQILAQLIPGAIDPTTPLEDVLNAPRWVVGARDMDFARPTVAIEEPAPAELDDWLIVAGLDVQRIPAGDERLGHAQIARRHTDGALEAAADPRSDGAARVLSCPAGGAGARH